jgi:uncharacterized protein
LAEGKLAWAIPWPCIHEFLAITTHSKIFSPPSPMRTARAQVEAWLESPTVTLLSESVGYWPILEQAVASAKVTGPQVHDARIASLCMQHGVAELWSADRDFNRFPSFRVRNPLIAN